MDGWVGAWLDGWVDGWMDGWVDGWVDGWLDGWVDGWMPKSEVFRGASLCRRVVATVVSKNGRQCLYFLGKAIIAAPLVLQDRGTAILRNVRS